MGYISIVKERRLDRKGREKGSVKKANVIHKINIFLFYVLTFTYLMTYLTYYN